MKKLKDKTNLFDGHPSIKGMAAKSWGEEGLD